MDARFINPKLLAQTERIENAKMLGSQRLGIVAYDNAVVYPGGGLVDGDGRFIEGTATYNWMPENEGAYPCAHIENVDEHVVYLGMFVDVWGHCLTDCLRRLWFFLSYSVPMHIKKLRFVWTKSNWGGNLPANFWRMLELLGYTETKMTFVERPTRFSRVYVPDSSFHFVRDNGFCHVEYTKEYVETIDAVIAKAMSHQPARCGMDKIYLSRTKWVNRKEFGEKYIEKCFENMGFKIVHPQGMALDELIATLQHTSEFAVTEGSAAHNAIFLPYGAKCYIVRKRPDVIAYQSPLNRIRKLKVTYIDANKTNLLFDKKYPAHGPFFLYVNRRMGDFAGVRPHFPMMEYIVYAFVVLKHNIAIRRRLKAVYDFIAKKRECDK